MWTLKYDRYQSIDFYSYYKKCGFNVRTMSIECEVNPYIKFFHKKTRIEVNKRWIHLYSFFFQLKTRIHRRILKRPISDLIYDLRPERLSIEHFDYNLASQSQNRSIVY